MVGVWDRVTPLRCGAVHVHNYNKPPAIVVLRGQWGKERHKRWAESSRARETVYLHVKDANDRE